MIFHVTFFVHFKCVSSDCITYVYLSIYPTFSLSIYLFIYLSIYIYIYISIYLSIYRNKYLALVNLFHYSEEVSTHKNVSRLIGTPLYWIPLYRVSVMLTPFHHNYPLTIFIITSCYKFPLNQFDLSLSNSSRTVVGYWFRQQRRTDPILVRGSGYWSECLVYRRQRVRCSFDNHSPR